MPRKRRVAPSVSPWILPPGTVTTAPPSAGARGASLDASDFEASFDASAFDGPFDDATRSSDEQPWKRAAEAITKTVRRVPLMTAPLYLRLDRSVSPCAPKAG